MVAQSTRMDGRRHKAVTECVHFDDRSHFCSITIIEGVRSLGDRWGGCWLDRNQTGTLAVLNILAQEGIGDPGEVRAAAHASDDHIGVFPGHVHLFKRLFPDHRLMCEHMVQH